MNRASTAEINLRFKVAFSLVCKREYVRLRSNFVMRFWWDICFPGVEFKVITCDQTPFWMNSSAEKKTVGPKGRGGAQVVEDFCASRERFSHFSVDYSYSRDTRPMTGVCFRGKTKRCTSNIKYRPADIYERIDIFVKC